MVYTCFQLVAVALQAHFGLSEQAISMFLLVAGMLACLMSCAWLLHIVQTRMLCNIRSLGSPYYGLMLASSCARVPAGPAASSPKYTYV